MSDQEDPMRTTVKPVHQWTTMDGKSAIRSPVVWLDGLLGILSAIYLIVPQRAWGWMKDRAKLLWKRIGHGEPHQ